MLLPESRFLLKLQKERLLLNSKETLVQEIFCEFYEIPKNISFTENHLATASGNDPGESLVLGGKSQRNASFLTRRRPEADLPLTIITKHSILDVAAALDPTLRRLCFNSSFVFAKSSTKRKVIASHNAIAIWWDFIYF